MNRVNALVAATVLAFLMAACGEEPGSFKRESIKIHAPAEARRIDTVMAQFQAVTGTGFTPVTRNATNPVPPADVYFAESFVGLWEMAEADRLRPVAASMNERVTADRLTDPERRFVPLAAAPRIVAFNASSVSDIEVRTISDFASLAEERWKGRLCLSSSRIDANRLLVAHMISRHAAREAEIAIRGWLRNLAMPEYETDAALLGAISLGECGVGILDARVADGAASTAGVRSHFFAEQDGWLFDVSGAGVSRHASNPAAASALLSWLLTADGNAAYSSGQAEIPLGIDSIQRHGQFSATQALRLAVSLSELGFLLEEADRLIDRAGYR